MSDKKADFGDFTSGEITFVIEHLASLVPQDEIQELFFKFTAETKRLPGTIIQQIQLKYSDRIRRQSEMYLSNVKGNPLAHPRS